MKKYLTAFLLLCMGFIPTLANADLSDVVYQHTNSADDEFSQLLSDYFKDNYKDGKLDGAGAEAFSYFMQTLKKSNGAITGREVKETCETAGWAPTKCEKFGSDLLDLWHKNDYMYSVKQLQEKYCGNCSGNCSVNRQDFVNENRREISVTCDGETMRINESYSKNQTGNFADINKKAENEFARIDSEFEEHRKQMDDKFKLFHEKKHADVNSKKKAFFDDMETVQALETSDDIAAHFRAKMKKEGKNFPSSAKYADLDKEADSLLDEAARVKNLDNDEDIAAHFRARMNKEGKKFPSDAKYADTKKKADGFFNDMDIDKKFDSNEDMADYYHNRMKKDRKELGSSDKYADIDKRSDELYEKRKKYCQIAGCSADETGYCDVTMRPDKTSVYCNGKTKYFDDNFNEIK